MNSPVDVPPGAPLWELLVSEGPNPETGEAAGEAAVEPEETVLVFRAHHALADGISGGALWRESRGVLNA